MKVLIETYREWEISFDTEKETFYTMSDYHDIEKTKNSYTLIKKYIDEYIKENNTFKPIKVESSPSYWRKGKSITLVGLRKDNCFMYEDEKGEKHQLSKYDEKEYFLVNEENKPYFERMFEIEREKKKLDAEFKEIDEKKLIRVGIEEIRNNLLFK